VSRGFLAVLAVAALFALTAAPSLQAAVVVKAVASDANPYDYAFRPKRLEVGAGTKVTWKAIAGYHNVTSTSKNWSKSSPLAIGDPTSHTFRKTGTFRYRCTIHSSLGEGTCTGQCGKVVVTG
jgi:plastocyanin